MVNLMNVCSAGHDLTLPNAYIYGANGNRLCRTCVMANGHKRGKPRGTGN